MESTLRSLVRAGVVLQMVAGGQVDLGGALLDDLP